MITPSIHHALEINLRIGNLHFLKQQTNMAKGIVLTCTILLAAMVVFASYDQAFAGHKGHVHINVWRGPSKGYKKHKFAPWGYWAKLPADESKHHYG
ncbi:hypothetical protein GZH46_02503 [Fragariocoptes setiger]|uniref:Uncharacterized protein n=1 Tax=Fragariocoptes setiger TaxID=1670756 RepID=A0ABQ7S6F7_9ACAR|nr:hypothetical protein GZH46_02503 [Fragariocoptes setiger]